MICTSISISSQDVWSRGLVIHNAADLRCIFRFRIKETMRICFSKILLTLGLLLSAIVAVGQQPDAGGPQTLTPKAADVSDVQHLMDAYHQSVVTHDGARLASLFLPDGTLWMNVLTDDTYATAKAKAPAAKKVRVGSYQDFVRLVTTSKSEMNPTKTNLQLHSDGSIASAYFDFVFFIDGKEQNRGSEMWQMVKGSDGWRIASIIFSSAPPKQAH